MIKKTFFIIFFLLLSFFLIPIISPAFALTWTKHENNPVLDLGSEGSWDSIDVSSPFVLFDGTTYKMWYQGYGPLNGVSTLRIGYATSPDGKNWTKYEGNPVLESNPNIPEERNVAEPAVLFSEQIYEMWYTSFSNTPANFRIGYATSPDGINWTHHSNYVLVPSENWEEEGVVSPFVLKENNVYKMWYAARDGVGIWRIGYAVSDNGITWIKNENNPIIEATTPWENSVVVLPRVIKFDSFYEMWYHAGPMIPIVFAYANSSDGINWSKPAEENPALERGPSGSFDHNLIVAPSVVKREDVYQMWYGGSDGSHWRIGYASTGEIPTPPPSKLPLILLPGLGASWNFQSIFLGNNVPQSEWKMTPFVKHYDNLIATLENADYTKNEDLFVFNYDWTKPIDQIADDFKEYIDGVVDPPQGESSGKKVKLIGHSLGGLVARAYIQNNPDNHQVNQLITLGSPHKGVVQIYKAWEGADLHNLLENPLRLTAELILALRGRKYQNKVEAIKNMIPSLKDLLFIDDYLKKHPWGKIISESSLKQQNSWLKNLGVSDELKDLLNPVVGKSKINNTSRWLKVVRQSSLDKKLGRWEDGRPVDEEYEIGDKTVLAASAGLEDTTTTEVALDHGDLVRTQEGITTILSLLELDAVPIVNSYPSDTPYLVFVLASPGNLRVTNPSGEKAGFDISPPTIPQSLFLTDEKMIVIPGAIDGKYKIEIVGNGESGAYRLLIGHLTEKEDVWQEYQDEISPSETDTYTIEIDENLETTPLALALDIKSKLKELLIKTNQSSLSWKRKMRIKTYIFKILTRLEAAIGLLKANKNQMAKKIIEKAILDSLKMRAYMEKYKVEAPLGPTRTIIDSLYQLHQLL
ncbi:alpha/beta hydrolase [Candidatus Microgenomates bacterium]|nr:alpha/beta hydrolase [Candidatus Microgenomates bacterium]